jgi:gas vesicle protein
MTNLPSKTLYLLAGIGVGVAVGILYAPKSGRETREVLARKTSEGMDYVRSKARDMLNVVERSKQMISHERMSISRAVRVGREAYRFDYPRANGPSTTHP